MTPIEKRRIAIVDDDCNFANILKYELEMNGYSSIDIYSEPSAFLKVMYNHYTTVVLDFQFEDTDGLQVLKEIKSFNPDIQVIMISAQNKISQAVETLKYGAFDYVEKGNENYSEVVKVLRKIEATQRVLRQIKKRKAKNKMLTWLSVAAVLTLLILKIPHLIH